MINNKIGDIRAKLYRGEDVLTRFLDFNEQKEIMSLADYKTHLSFFGGSNDNERVRCYLSNEIKDDIDYEITILKSNYESKFQEINHRHVLGTIMSLGIERNTFGDIIVKDDEVIIFVSNDIKEYIKENLTLINRIRFKFTEITEYINSNENEIEKIINVPSLRLDAVISKACNLSRDKAAELIESGLVLINYKECTKVSYNVDLGDVLSIRHFGRIKILENMGMSKKERINLKINVKH